MKDSLEEVAEIICHTHKTPLEQANEVVKLLQERSYSEEEVLTMLLIKHDGLTPEYVLQQFKIFLNETNS